MVERALGLGDRSSSYGERGITKRLGALERLTPIEGRRLLDVGCANGTYTIRMADNFDEVHAVDVEPERLTDFHTLIDGTPLADKIHIANMPAEDLRFANEMFDVVTTIEVLEHVTDLTKSLSEIHRVLKPGGRLLITSPNRYFPFETHGFLVNGRRYRASRGPFLPWIIPLHNRLADARSFTVRGLTATVEERGFERTGVDYVMPPFDRSRFGQRIRPVVDAIERSPFKFFGMALVLVFRKLAP